MHASDLDDSGGQDRWFPWWGIPLAVLSLLLLAAVAAPLVPDVARSWASMQRAQDLGNTLGVFVGGVWLGLVLASAVPSVWFLLAGGRTMLWTGVGLALFWFGGMLALIGPDLPLVLDGLF